METFTNGSHGENYKDVNSEISISLHEFLKLSPNRDSHIPRECYYCKSGSFEYYPMWFLGWVTYDESYTKGMLEHSSGSVTRANDNEIYFRAHKRELLRE